MTATCETVLILGFGEMGHAMVKLLGARHEILIWDKYPSAGMVSVVLEDAAPGADIIVFCLPMNPHREIATRVASLLKPGAICISIAKGLDESGETAAQVFDDSFAAEHTEYALLYGPMIAEELSAGRPGFAQLGCSSVAACGRIQSLFADTMLMVTACEDIPGISWSVVLKNVYAILFGIADELQLGDNIRGFLMTMAVAELGAIVSNLGGDAVTANGLAGLGDLVATATSEHSHHHQLGRRLARGETEKISGEGAHTLAMVERHVLFDTTEYPLFSLVKRLVSRPQFAERDILEFAKRSVQ